MDGRSPIPVKLLTFVFAAVLLPGCARSRGVGSAREEAASARTGDGKRSPGSARPPVPVAVAGSRPVPSHASLLSEGLDLLKRACPVPLTRKLCIVETVKTGHGSRLTRVRARNPALVKDATQRLHKAMAFLKAQTGSKEGPASKARKRMLGRAMLALADLKLEKYLSLKADPRDPAFRKTAAKKLREKAFLLVELLRAYHDVERLAAGTAGGLRLAALARMGASHEDWARQYCRMIEATLPVGYPFHQCGRTGRFGGYPDSRVEQAKEAYLRYARPSQIEAKKTYARCVSLARRYGIDNTWSRLCGERLAAVDRTCASVRF